VWHALFPLLYGGCDPEWPFESAPAGLNNVGRALIEKLASGDMLLTGADARTTESRAPHERTFRFLQAASARPAAALAHFVGSTIALVGRGWPLEAAGRCLVQLGAQRILIESEDGDLARRLGAELMRTEALGSKQVDVVIATEQPQGALSSVPWIGIWSRPGGLLVGPWAESGLSTNQPHQFSDMSADISPVAGSLAGNVAALQALYWIAAMDHDVLREEMWIDSAAPATPPRNREESGQAGSKSAPQEMPPPYAALTSSSQGCLPFVLFQARPQGVFSRPSKGSSEPTGPPTTVRYLTADPIALNPDEDALLHDVIYRGEPSRTAGSTRWQRFQALLSGAAGYQRYEPGNSYNPHRGHPSAQSRFPTDLFVVAGQCAWHFDPVWARLLQVGGAAQPPSELPELINGGDQLAIVVAGRPTKLPSYYEELRWSLTLCETGHVLGNLLLLGDALSLDPRLATGSPDQPLLEMLGAAPDDGWLLSSLVEFGREDTTFTAVADPWPMPADPVLLADRWAWTPAVEGPTIVAEPTGADEQYPSDLYSQLDETNLPPETPSARSWAEVIFSRSSGQGYSGLTASPQPLSVNAVGDVLRAMGAAATAWKSRVPTSGMRLLIAVERVYGFSDGLYEWILDEQRLFRVRLGGFMGTVQHAFAYPPNVTRVDTCNAAIICSSPYSAISQRGGARGLRLSQIELGMVVQAGALAASSHDVFLRPCRSFDCDELASLLPRKGSYVPSYLCLLGKSSFDDLMLDLRPGSIG